MTDDGPSRTPRPPPPPLLFSPPLPPTCFSPLPLPPLLLPIPTLEGRLLPPPPSQIRLPLVGMHNRLRRRRERDREEGRRKEAGGGKATPPSPPTHFCERKVGGRGEMGEFSSGRMKTPFFAAEKWGGGNESGNNVESMLNSECTGREVFSAEFLATRIGATARFLRTVQGATSYFKVNSQTTKNVSGRALHKALKKIRSEQLLTNLHRYFF